MKALKEPALHGKPQDQDDRGELPYQAAVSDPRPLSAGRHRALGRFQDPRCAGPLVQAYQAAADKSFAPDHVNTIRCEVLAASAPRKRPRGGHGPARHRRPAKREKIGHPAGPASNQADPLQKASPLDDDDPAQRNLRLSAVRALGEQGKCRPCRC